jgi:hypothetical protein
MDHDTLAVYDNLEKFSSISHHLVKLTSTSRQSFRTKMDPSGYVSGSFGELNESSSDRQERNFSPETLFTKPMARKLVESLKRKQNRP